MEVMADDLAAFFRTVQPHLDERQRRVLLGASAELLGRGGRTAVARASGMSRTTVVRSVKELAQIPYWSGRTRAPGGGDKRAIAKQTGLLAALVALLRPSEGEQSTAHVMWTSRSTYALADELSSQGFSVSSELVRRLLHEMGFTMRRRARTASRLDDAEIDAQFTRLDALVAYFAAEPVQHPWRLHHLETRMETWQTRARSSRPRSGIQMS